MKEFLQDYVVSGRDNKNHGKIGELELESTRYINPLYEEETKILSLTARVRQDKDKE